MKSCGVIAEYNPFHNGHRYQLEEAKKQTGSDVMLVVMSGNFTQRGEPAILDKWKRAEMALLNGADLVVEQDVLGSVQAADLFAKTGVRLLQRLECNHLSFGAESGTAMQFLEITQQQIVNKEAINVAFQLKRNDGRTYPAQMQEALTEVLGSELSFPIWEPNNQLGLSYLRENAQYVRPMEAIVIKRQGAKHHDELDREQEFASGTAIRGLLETDDLESLAKWVPENAADLLRSAARVSWNDLWPLLRYRLVSDDVSSLRKIYQMEEGIEHRLKKMVLDAGSFSDFIGLVKNKRWTWTRLQRLCVMTLLGITKSDVAVFFEEPPPIRVLGFTKQGQQYLSELKKKGVPFITNLTQSNHVEIQQILKADDIYRLANKEGIREQNFTRQPIRV